jgi:hypothetical protein
MKRRLLTALLLSVVGLLGTLASEPSPASRVIDQFYAAFNAHDVERMLALTAPEISWLSIDGNQVNVDADGQAALREFMTGYFQSLPTVRSTIVSRIENGSWVSLVEEAQWERQGAVRRQRALAVFEQAGEKIRRVWYDPTVK